MYISPVYVYGYKYEHIPLPLLTTKTFLQLNPWRTEPPTFFNFPVLPNAIWGYTLVLDNYP